LTCGGRVRTQLRRLGEAAAAVYGGGGCMGNNSSCGGRAGVGCKCSSYRPRASEGPVTAPAGVVWRNTAAAWVRLLKAGVWSGGGGGRVGCFGCRQNTGTSGAGMWQSRSRCCYSWRRCCRQQTQWLLQVLAQHWGFLVAAGATVNRACWGNEDVVCRLTLPSECVAAIAAVATAYSVSLYLCILQQHGTRVPVEVGTTPGGCCGWCNTPY
jgi:hypothetical protein